MKIVFTESISKDLKEIENYLKNKTGTGFISIKLGLLHRIKNLELFNEIGVKVKNKNIYKLTLNKYNYKIFYSILNDEIRILRFVHDRKNFKI